jgi:acetyl-CoA acyltransferase
MREAFIVCPQRSAVGKAYRGSLASKRPDDLAADIIRAVVEGSSVDPAKIEDVIMGCAMPEAEQGMNVARFALLLAGLPDKVPGVTVNRFCSSGLQTIAMAASQIKAGDADCLLAGGTESMTAVPMMGHKVVGSRKVMAEHPEFYLGMGLTAENVAKDYKISREDQDAFAVESHMRAVTAIEKGWFKEEITKVTVERRNPAENGTVNLQSFEFEQDDGPRPETSLEALARLKPAFLSFGSVTAGNTSQMSDGCGMCLVVTEEFAKKNNLKPIAKMRSFAVAGVAPRVMGIGPVEAIPMALKRAGLKEKDLERIELNEAFAAQALAVIRTLKLDPKIVNPTGGAIALGHPLGATGAKLTATLLHGMKRDKQKIGAVTMCIGTGMGACGVFELL